MERTLSAWTANSVDLERLEPYLLLAAAVLLLVGWLMILLAAFRVRWYWGVGVLVIPPAALLFLWFHFRKGLSGFLMFTLAVVCAVTPTVVNRLHLLAPADQPIENVVDGEPTLTVTGAKDFDYTTLRDKPYLEVLQMANEEVTDQTLENLKSLRKLRELDLSNTQITDAGLRTLRELPKLEILRLNGTKITDEGVKENIFPITSLRELNVLRTKISKKTRDEWRAAQEGRKVTPVF